MQCLSLQSLSWKLNAFAWNLLILLFFFCIMKIRAFIVQDVHTCLLKVIRKMNFPFEVTQFGLTGESMLCLIWGSLEKPQQSSSRLLRAFKVNLLSHTCIKTCAIHTNRDRQRNKQKKKKFFPNNTQMICNKYVTINVISMKLLRWQLN